MTDYKNSDHKIPLFLPHSSVSTELNKTGSWRYVHPLYDEKTAPCSAACPLGQDIARIEHLATQNLIAEAWQTILIENPFPAICGRVCYHHCENACNRGQLDEPVAIHHLERFIADTQLAQTSAIAVKPLPANDKNVAIAGAGPAGLAAAYFLSLLGYHCDVYEASAAPGGIMRWGIPAYRLPQNVLEKEISRIEGLGVTLHCRTPVTTDMLEGFKTQYDALFIGCGYGRSIDLKINGAHMAEDGLQLLNRLRADKNVFLTGEAAIIGGGNTAVDVARTLVRLGVEPMIVYRRRRQDMPAFDPEVEMALAEGVKLKTLLAPIDIADLASDTPNQEPLFSMTLQKMKISATDINGRPRVVPDGNDIETLQVNHIFTAIGAEPSETWHHVPQGDYSRISLSHCHLINGQLPMVYGGDLTNHTKSVSDAIASGKQAAIALDSCFNSGWDAIKKAIAGCQVGSGPSVSMAMYMGMARKDRNPHIVSAGEINTHYFKGAARVVAPVVSAEDRIQSFSPVESVLSEAAALAESRRCFNCGICNACDFCRLYCPDMSVLLEDERRSINLDYCKGCGLCVAECPRNAMALKEEGV
ncbi:MAG: FAD-dependent oxidoreductase [Desulfobacterales bacterium]